MDDSEEWELDDGPKPPDNCALGLQKYFYFIAAVAVAILGGTYWYVEHYDVKTGAAASLSVPGLPGNGKTAVNAHPLNQLAVNARPNNQAVANAVPNMSPKVAPGIPVMRNVGSGGFSSVAMALRNSIVNISTTGGPNRPVADVAGVDTVRFANPFSKRSNGSIGSGVIIRDDGYIVSNYHIIRGAGSITVTVFADQGTQRYMARVVKMDEVMDLVLLKIDPATRLRAASLGDSSRLQVATEVITIGSPFGLDQTVSRGIVSALRKALEIEGITHANLIQTDAAINQGNSGGALIDSNGNVIGINTAIYTPTGAFAGIGFAIPSNQVRQFMLDEMGQPLAAARGFTVAAPAPPGPPAPRISANERPPGSHNDGRNAMNCASCHQITGGGGGANGVLAAAPAGPPAPRISANERPPGNHNDGRNAMNCASCHQITGGGAQGIAAAAPRSGIATAAPTISTNSRPPGNHNDGRNAMNCTACHQFTAGIAPVAMQAALQFTAPPANLAMNIAVPTAGTFGVPGSNVSLMGAGIMRINAALAERLQQPRDRGVFVSQVALGSSAAIHGLKAGDIILKVEGKRIWAPGQLVDMMRSLGNGNMVRLGVLHDGKKKNIDILIELPQAGTESAQVSAVMKARVLPNEFNWRGINVENFVVAGMPPKPGAASPRGAKIDGVAKGSPAARAGLRGRDIILKINSDTVGKPEQLDQAIRKARGQTSNLLLVLRGGREFFVVLP